MNVSTSAQLLQQLVADGIDTYAKPDSALALAGTCAAFFVTMLALCWAAERANPNVAAMDADQLAKRRQEILGQIKHSMPAVVCSTCYSLGW